MTTTKSRYVGLRLPTELYQAAKDRAEQSAKTGLRQTGLRVLGNAVVPRVAECIGRAIVESRSFQNPTSSMTDG